MSGRDVASQRSISDLIGTALREARLARGVTQEQLAQAFSVDRVTIARYERGARMISAATLMEMLAFLGRPVALPGESTTISPNPGASGDPSIERLVRVLERRPDLIATVQDLLETLGAWPDQPADE